MPFSSPRVRKGRHLSTLFSHPPDTQRRLQQLTELEPDGARRVKLFDVLLGRTSPLNPPRPPVRAPWAQLTLEAPWPAPHGQAGVASRPATGQQFADTLRRSRPTGREHEDPRRVRSYGYRWAVITDDDFGDLINEVNLNTTLQDQAGTTAALLVFGFAPIAPAVQAIRAAAGQARRRWRHLPGVPVQAGNLTPSYRCRSAEQRDSEPSGC